MPVNRAHFRPTATQLAELKLASFLFGARLRERRAETNNQMLDREHDRVQIKRFAAETPAPSCFGPQP